jgi:hypothetical protein
MRNDIVFPRNEAVSAMMRDGGSSTMASTSTDTGMQAHTMGNGTQQMQEQLQVLVRTFFFFFIIFIKSDV